MKKAALLLALCTVQLSAVQLGPALLAQFREPPNVASTDPNPDYPLHIRILSADRNHNQFGYHGFGRGDLTAPTLRGFDYTFDCGEGFLHNAEPGEFYQGKWKKPDSRIEILTQRVGSNHVDKCELKVTMKPVPYGKYKPQP